MTNRMTRCYSCRELVLLAQRQCPVCFSLLTPWSRKGVLATALVFVALSGALLLSSERTERLDAQRALQQPQHWGAMELLANRVEGVLEQLAMATDASPAQVAGALFATQQQLEQVSGTPVPLGRLTHRALQVAQADNDAHTLGQVMAQVAKEQQADPTSFFRPRA
ncbi:hypothetical protein KUV89_01015 [Marinobacter hydrocarbonoclasticus]|nr:hypothetical protein [Marinobacter nauticus]